MKQLATLLFALFTVACTTVAPAPSYREQARELSPSVVILQGDEGRVFCSGVVIEKDLIVTAKHCVDGGDLKSVRSYDGSRYYPLDVRMSEEYDVAYIRIARGDLTPVRIGNPDESEVGDFVLAIGHPFGHRFVVTAGFIVKKSNEPTDFAKGDHFEHTATVNPGNSGGALFNERGELIGINNWGILSSGLYFALKIDRVLAERAALGI